MTVRAITTQYGAPALHALKQAVEQIKSTDPMAKTTILVGSDLAGVAARRHLAVGVNGMSGVAGLDVTTLPRLAERMATAEMAPQRPAVGPVIAIAMRSALATVPGPFADAADNPSTVRALAAAYPTLRDVSPEAVQSIAGATPLAAAVVGMHNAVVDQLHDRWYDSADILTAAASRASQAQLGSCILYLPVRLSQREVELVRQVAAVTDLTVIAGLTGVRRADRGVVDILQRLQLDANQDTTIPTASKIITASDSDDEVRCVIRELMATLQSTPSNRVAILYSQRLPYARLLHEQLEAAGITVNGPGTRPVTERATARMLLEVLGLGAGDLPRAGLFRAISGLPVVDFTGRRIHISRWERISRSAGITAGDTWALRLDAYISDRRAEVDQQRAATDPRQPIIDRLERDSEEASALRAFALLLHSELNRASSLTSWSQLCAWCAELYATLLKGEYALDRLPREEQYAVVTVQSLLETLAGLDDLQPDASLEVLRDVLDTELSRTIPRVGRFGDGVFVGPVSAAPGLDLDVVFTVGLSEDLYPGRLRADPLLPDVVRAAAGGELPLQAEQLSDKHHQLLAAFATGRRCVASFPRGDLRRSSRRLPSRFLLNSLRELSGDHRLAASDWESIVALESVDSSSSFAGSLLHTDTLATPQEWRTRAASSPRSLADPAVDSAIEMIRARASDTLSRFDGNVAGATSLPDYAHEDRLISPTGLEVYASCPHRFFIERLLGVAPIEEPEDILVISPLEIGNLVHESVDELIKECRTDLPEPGEPWSAAQHQRLVELAQRKADDFSQRGLTGHPRLWEVERRKIISDVEALLHEDSRWRADKVIKPVASELPFGMRGADPVRVPVADGEVKLRGSADKIDIGADGTIYVTDLKTGGTSSYLTIKQDDPFAGGTKLQLPVYGYAARATFGDANSPVAAAYWFVRKAPDKRIGIDITPEVEAAYAETIGAIVRSIAAGLFPAKAPDAPDFGWVQCPYCNPDGISHQDVRRRWERKRHDPVLRELVQLIDPTAFEDVS